MHQTFDKLAFEIELRLRGDGGVGRRRAKPHMSEMDARCKSMELARWLRETYTLTRKADYSGH